VNAAESAAAAVHSVLPVAPRFPAVGKIVSIGGVNTAGKLVGLVVTVDGVRYEGAGLFWSGPFAVEATIPNPRTLIGRDVKVESIGGRMVVAYTINGGS
jgi:hypothetical protein